MFRWFRRADPEEEDLEEEGDEVALPEEIDFGEQGEPAPPARPLPEVPEFAVVVSASGTNGWHMAAVVTDTNGPDFYLRAITVRWPFVVARPTPSSRVSNRLVDPHLLSPTGSTPARKLVVNWGWTKLEDQFSQLRFYVKRTPSVWLSGTARLRARLTLKESGGPRRRVVVPVQSNVIAWHARVPEKPASPPEQST